MSENKNVVKLLENIWLNTTDAEVYLASIHLGASTIKQLTTHTQQNRITVHDSVWRLVQKWIILETYSWRKRLIFPQTIDKLQLLVEHKQAELVQYENDVRSTIWVLQWLHSQSQFLPRIRLSKWHTWISSLLYEIKQDKPDTVMTISDSHHFDELLNVKFLDTFSSLKKSCSLQIISPSWFEHFIFSAKAKNINIKYRTIQNEAWSGGMTLWWSKSWKKVALHAYEWVYITTTIIDNPPIYTMMKHCYQCLWNTAHDI